MPIVNYVREHIRFMEYASDEHLNASERLLWYALMHLMNQRAQGKVWPDEFIRINNDRLLSFCPMKIDTIASARNSLKQRGLIEYIPGEKNKKSPAYRMVYFYPEYIAPDTESDADYPQCNTENSDYMGGYTGVYTGGYIGGNPGGYTGNNSINNIPGHIRSGIQEHEEDDETDTRFYTPAERASIRQAWARAFGKMPNHLAFGELVAFAEACEFECADVICEAIRRAGLRGANDPLAYIKALLDDWCQHGAYTLRDVKRYISLERNGA